MRGALLALLLGGAGLLAAPAGAAETTEAPAPSSGTASPWTRVDREASVLAIVTRKAGMASGLAHDHLVVAGEWTGEVAVDLEDPERSSGHVVVPVAGLRADHPDDQDRWEGAIRAAGIREDAFPRLDESDRRKILESLRDEGQLDLEGHPEIEARLLGLERKAGEGQGGDRPWTARLEIRIRDRTVPVELATTIEEAEDHLDVEAVGALRFTDFGIEPYSAFFGAVKNRDVFDVYLRLRLAR